ncbi:hypothetical protein Zm00014a_023433 [Zea mays]|uniref:Uncharacterized protein n=1 Tax=Zea mays TaxID=4577 RepID=A0A3L6GCK0_MAIZE|nr:hypothetical protein Zm00014a_023433 [Zea mays]
MCASMQPNHPE